MPRLPVQLLATLVAAIALAGLLAVFNLHNEQSRDEARSEALRRAGVEGLALQRELDRTLHAPLALAAFIQLNDGQVDGFREFTDQMRALLPGITNLQLAPDGVVTHIHPLEGHEAAIGHELLVDRERSTEAFAAVDTRLLTLAGPFELVQGGVAMVGRQPIYVPGAGNVAGVDPDFWGFATVLMYLDDFFDASRIDELADEGYHYELASFDRDQNRFVPFWGSGTVVDPVSVEVSVANGTWLLSLDRPDGWGQSGWSLLQLVAAGALALATGGAVAGFGRRRRRLEAVVDERTQELRDANLELVRARDDAERANHAKTAFLSNVSHELRTPMNAIMGFGELIDIERLDERDAQSVAQIRQAGKHLLLLINDVLDVTAIESGNLTIELTPVDVDEVVRQTHQLLSPLADARDVRLTFQGSGAVAAAQENRLVQIVSNLISNAIKFTAAGGCAHVATAMDDRGCHIVVSDDGIGIADDHLERIFEPFERAGAPPTAAGTGLGLAIVAKLVNAMGGRVRVESSVGAGSTFTVSLPAVPMTPSRDCRSGVTEPPKLRGATASATYRSIKSTTAVSSDP